MTNSVMTSDLTLNQLKSNENGFEDNFDSQRVRLELTSGDNELKSGLQLSPIGSSVNTCPQQLSSTKNESNPKQNIHSLSHLNNSFEDNKRIDKSVIHSTDLSSDEDHNQCSDLLSDNNTTNNNINNLFNLSLNSNNIKRIELDEQKMMSLTVQEFRHHWNEQQLYINSIESQLRQLNRDKSDLISLRESEEKLKQQQLEANRRENVLVMRLTTKEQEMQECMNQIQELKQTQVPSSSQMQTTLIDPSINLMFDKMRKEVDFSRAKVEEMQDELNAWKFTPDSTTGKRLMSKCRLLYQENEELGRLIESGRIAKLEGELSLQKNFSEELKKSQSEIDEFLLELDEDVEGMQNTIYYLQQQLKESKERLAKYEANEQNNRQCVHQNSNTNLDSNNVKNSEVFERTFSSSDTNREGVKQNNGSTIESMDTAVNDNNAPIDSVNRTEEMSNSVKSETTVDSNNEENSLHNNNYLSFVNKTNNFNESINKRTSSFDQSNEDQLDIDDDHKQPSLKMAKLNDNKTSVEENICNQTNTDLNLISSDSLTSSPFKTSQCIEMNGQTDP